MVLSTFKYSGLSTKIKVMLGRMLTDTDYKELISKKSVADIVVYLKENTYYKNILQDINENSIHRGQLEQIFKRSFIYEYKKLFKFIRGDIRKFLKFVYLRFEIEDLKILLRVLNTEHNTSNVHDSLLFLKGYSTIDIPKLSSSRNIQEFIQNLKGSIYFHVLSPFINNTEYLNIFSIEMTLDMHFFSTIWKQKHKLLTGEDRSIISRSLGSEIDILNLLWIYRSKKFYNIPNEIIYSYIIPYRYNITMKQLVSIVEAHTIEEAERIIHSTKYVYIFTDEDDNFYERNFVHYIFKMQKKFLRENNYSIASLMAYLHLKEIEIKNITNIIEGIRYGLEPAQIRKYVVGIE